MGWEGDMNDPLAPCESQCYDGLMGLFFLGECGHVFPWGCMIPRGLESVIWRDLEGVIWRMTWCVWWMGGSWLDV